MIDFFNVKGWKTEKNLKFLLQKVLKQSDVGNLGRIVLPKVYTNSCLHYLLDLFSSTILYML